MRLNVNICCRNGVKRVKLNHRDTDSYYRLVETDDVFEDFTGDVEKNGLTKWFAATVPKSCSYCVQKYNHEIEDLDIIRAKGVKVLVSKELRVSDYEKCFFDLINAPITKEQVRFRNIKHVTHKQ